VFQENIFHTKMMLKEFDLDTYLFGVDAKDLDQKEQKKIRRRLEREMLEIFFGQNINKMPR
jgi:S-adenosylmethionine decarboxylase